jgi:hypothetical protein
LFRRELSTQILDRFDERFRFAAAFDGVLRYSRRHAERLGFRKRLYRCRWNRRFGTRRRRCDSQQRVGKVAPGIKLRRPNSNRRFKLGELG